MTLGPRGKGAVVIGGYVAAFAFAVAVTATWVAATDGPDAQASSGMHAFGDGMLFLAAFGVAALVPTGAALHFLRSSRGFWNWFTVLCGVAASTGVLAAIVFALGRNAMGGALAIGAAFAVIRILVAPVFVLGFIVCAWFAPRRPHRIAFLAATGAEAATAAYGGFTWFLPLLMP